MRFQNGESSPFFEIDDTVGDIEGTLDIDKDKEIRYVSMELRGGLMYTGITFYDDNQAIISTFTWSDNELRRKTPAYKIPEGQRIIGFKCTTEGANFSHLAFFLAERNEVEIVGELRFPTMEEFPKEDDFETLYASDFRLAAINYKQYSDFYGLSGI